MSVHRCELCCQYHSRENILLLKLDFSEKPVKIAGIVPDWYCGIRILCRFCVEELKNLPYFVDQDHGR